MMTEGQRRSFCKDTPHGTNTNTFVSSLIGGKTKKMRGGKNEENAKDTPHVLFKKPS
jgi:hypothetical protein